jgi:hypothetical protein
MQAALKQLRVDLQVISINQKGSLTNDPFLFFLLLSDSCYRIQPGGNSGRNNARDHSDYG